MMFSISWFSLFTLLSAFCHRCLEPRGLAIPGRRGHRWRMVDRSVSGLRRMARRAPNHGRGLDAHRATTSVFFWPPSPTTSLAAASGGDTCLWWAALPAHPGGFYSQQRPGTGTVGDQARRSWQAVENAPRVPGTLLAAVSPPHHLQFDLPDRVAGRFVGGFGLRAGGDDLYRDANGRTAVDAARLASYSTALAGNGDGAGRSDRAAAC